MSAPLVQLFPVKLLWKRILLAIINQYIVQPDNIFANVNIPYSGIAHIYISVSAPGVIPWIKFNNEEAVGGFTTGSYLNNGNALSPSTWYEFDLYVTGGETLQFGWTPSSSSVTSTRITIYIYLDLEDD